MDCKSNIKSAYYQSQTFDLLLNFITAYPRRCNLREANGKRSVVIDQVKSVEEGVAILEKIKTINS